MERKILSGAIMETKDKTITENIETAEVPEIIDNDKEESSVPNVEDKSEPDLDEFWNRIDECERPACRYIKNQKNGHIATGLGLCIGLILYGFMIYGVWVAASDCFAMMAGERFAYSYSLLDRDLLFSAPFCLLVAVVVGLLSERHKLLCTILYFLALLFILEIWDYWHIEYTANGTLGGLCFVIMFIIVPVLSIVRFIVSFFTDNEQGDEAEENNESESNVIVGDSN